MGKKKRRKKRGRLKTKNIFFTILVLGLIIWILCTHENKTEVVPANDVNNFSESIPDESYIATESQNITTEPVITTTVTTEPDIKMEYPVLSPNSKILSDEEITSKHAILIDTSNNEIIAYKDYSTRMYPASLTKIMTLIVAVENTENFDETELITSEMIEPMIEQDATRAGFAAGETPTITDLLYGLILPSGADASIALANHISGSESAFVELMNKKCQELGLKDTHFTNCVGLHNPEHYSTVQDMAIILQYAMQNDICRQVLTTYEYFIEPTEYNPEGLTLTSTMFQRMSGDEMEGVTVKGGKTGYTDEAGQCLASFAEINGKEYVMVLANNISRWYVVYDTLSAYSVYVYGGSSYIPPQ